MLVPDTIPPVFIWLIFMNSIPLRMHGRGELGQLSAKSRGVLGLGEEAGVFDRRGRLPAHVFQLSNRLLDGFEGKLTTSKWAKLAKCSQDTALRDILDLIEHDILIRNSEGGRSTSYALANTP
jgi:hypothetical protein